MFRITKRRFQVMMEDIQGHQIKLNATNPSANGIPGASFEAKLLLPLKCLAYGVPSHTFCDFFQMSKQLARDCCQQFDLAIKRCYQKEYLRLPSAEDLKNIVALHKEIHQVDGMVGSLDCPPSLPSPPPRPCAARSRAPCRALAIAPPRPRCAA